VLAAPFVSKRQASALGYNDSQLGGDPIPTGSSCSTPSAALKVVAQLPERLKYLSLVQPKGAIVMFARGDHVGDCSLQRVSGPGLTQSCQASARLRRAVFPSCRDNRVRPAHAVRSHEREMVGQHDATSLPVNDDSFVGTAQVVPLELAEAGRAKRHFEFCCRRDLTRRRRCQHIEVHRRSARRRHSIIVQHDLQSDDAPARREGRMDPAQQHLTLLRCQEMEKPCDESNVVRTSERRKDSRSFSTSPPMCAPKER
jgi:hypothetical protein